MSTEQLLAVFNGLTIKYGLSVEINPEASKIPKGSTVVLDVEHDESAGFVCCGLSVVGNDSIYVFSDLELLSNLPFLSFSIIGHNAKTDIEILRQWGIDVKDTQLTWDIGLVQHILDSSLPSYGLKSLAERTLSIVYPSYDDIVGKKTKKQKTERLTLDKQPFELVSIYNAFDVYVTKLLYERQSVSILSSAGKASDLPTAVQYFEQIEKPVSFILQQMENRGICVNLRYLKELRETLEAQKEPIEKEIKNELGYINLSSPKQLLEALNEKGIYPTFKGKPSTDKRALSVLHDIETVSLLLKYSEIDTLLSSFVNPYLDSGQSVVHSWFNQCGTRTGRLSCSNPNLLQIPRKTENGKKVRRMFVPRPGMLMGDFDYGQIEPRVMAHLSKDPVLCQMFNDGTDFHDYTALRLGISRDRAKVLNLSVGYRASKYSVQRQMGGTLDEAQIEIDKWWSVFPGLRRWQDTLIYDAKRSGFCTTLLGRRIRVNGLTNGNMWQREAAERQLINNITQGSAAEIMKMAMIGIEKAQRMACFSPSFGLLVQVYDELLFESPDIDEDLKGVRHSMENAVKLDVPLTVDCHTGESWAECH